MFAYIPARGGSKRIPKKNIKTLGNKPLICHTIEALIATNKLSGIAISTDSVEVREVVKKYSQVVVLDDRKPELCDDHSTFMDLVNKDLDRYCSHFKTTSVLFTLPTAALVTDSNYKEGIELFNKDNKSLVISVTPYECSAFFSFKDLGNGLVEPLFPDSFLIPTKDIPKTYYDSGCFYIFDKKLMEGKSKFLDLSPIQAVTLPKNIGIDLDNLEDWKRLEKEYACLTDK